MAIYVTGDIHARPERLGSNTFAAGKELTKDDYVIICGDFGLVWDREKDNTYEKHWLDWLEEKPFTTLFVDGNHENFDRLYDDNEFPYEDWNGGKIQRIRPNVIHLCRGYVFNIDGYKILAMGGNHSHDIQDGILNPDDFDSWEEFKKYWREYDKRHPLAMYRVYGISWWPGEVPTEEERQRCIDNLALVNNKVDFVISHCLPSSDIFLMDRFFAQPNELEFWFEENIHVPIEYKRWYSGHYHIDKAITDKEISIYEKIERIA